MQLKSEITKIADTRIKIECEISANDVKSELTKQYKKYAKKYKFPGFRPGKAPRPVIDAALGKETIAAEATQVIADDAYYQLIADEDIYPVGDPKVIAEESMVCVEDNKPYTMVVELEVSPVVELSNYDPIQGYLPPCEVDDEELEQHIKNYLRYYEKEGEELELTDEVAKEKMGFDDAKAARESIAEIVKGDKENMLPRIKEQVVANALRDRVTTEPTDEFLNYINQVLLSEHYNTLQQNGLTFDAYLKMADMSADDFYEDVKKQAVDEAKTRMGLDAWAHHFDCECTDDDITAEFAKYGEGDAEDLKQRWIYAGRLWQLKQGITRQKAAKNAIEQATFEFDKEKSEAQFKVADKSEDKKSEDKEKKKSTKTSSKAKKEPKDSEADKDKKPAKSKSKSTSSAKSETNTKSKSKAKDNEESDK